MRYRSVLLPLLFVPALAGAPAPITVYLAGDSTMAEKRPDRRPETGWGEALQQHFDPGTVRVANHAANGRSTRTFIAEGRWRLIVDSLRPGDYVFIQFGHNDGSKEKVDRYTPPDDYRANLVRMVGDVRARRAHPVLLTPIRRRKFDAEGKLVDTHGEYPDLVRAVAAEQRVPLIDMHGSTADLLARWGADSSRTLFLQLAPGAHPNYPNGIEDNTHLRPLGAELLARLAVDGIREAKLGLAEHLRATSSRAAAPAR
jgi:lysophospholipase L1-like esterase